MLFSKLKPTFRADSIYDFDFRQAAGQGLRGVILDIDNTLVPHNAPADERCRAFLDSLRGMGLRLMIVSNNHEPRARAFGEAVGVPWLCDAGKPGTKMYRKALEQMGLRKDEVLCVGDQLLTDIWGANNAGIASLLVEPLDRSTDTPWIRVKRVLETPIKHLHNGKMSGNIFQEKNFGGKTK